MVYNQLLVLNTEGKILKINSTKQDNYHKRKLSSHVINNLYPSSIFLAPLPP